MGRKRLLSGEGIVNTFKIKTSAFQADGFINLFMVFFYMKV